VKAILLAITQTPVLLVTCN